MTGDHQIIGTDDLASTLQIRADLAIMRRGALIVGISLVSAAGAPRRLSPAHAQEAWELIP